MSHMYTPDLQNCEMINGFFKLLSLKKLVMQQKKTNTWIPDQSNPERTVVLVKVLGTLIAVSKQSYVRHTQLS